jgi:hypothetical protein
MGVLRLGICIGGVYSTFLLWAIAQERRESHSSMTLRSNSLDQALDQARDERDVQRFRLARSIRNGSKEYRK